ncbi:MAG: 5'-methylthioadenosine/S-adenosylhomocysteine nucleosidase [Clostridia bacterium]|nr:5'-methylthioadenosine/S-adenosylhomocysteine nucleosidase [Clostridia bacterium]
MESVAIYTVSNQYKIPAISIKIISNNELLEEPYNPSVGQKLQKITEEIIKKYRS